MKCRNIEARELARRLIKGETVTRDMASSDESWIAARASAKAVPDRRRRNWADSRLPVARLGTAGFCLEADLSQPR
jgi:hypothetical protein